METKLDCPKLDTCPRVARVLDQDLLGPQYLELVQQMCGKCLGPTVETPPAALR